MHTIKLSSLLGVVLFLAGGARCQSANQAATSEELVSRAIKVEDLWVAGTPPMILRAGIDVRLANGKIAHGGYAYAWNGPEQWREEIRFADYFRTRTGNSKGYWQKSNLDYAPEFLHYIDRMTHPSSLIRVSPEETIGKVKERIAGGEKLQCAGRQSQKGIPAYTACFSETDGTLVSVEYPNPVDMLRITRMEFRGFTKIGSKLVPFEIQGLLRKDAVLTIKVQEAKEAAFENRALFNKPEGAEFWESCDDLRMPEILTRVQPKYPEEARRSGQMGRVGIYAVVEMDGKLSHLAVNYSAGKLLDQESLRAVSQWRYKPAVCGTVPVRYEITIDVVFSLSH